MSAIEKTPLDEALWRMQNSLECTERWLDAGCDPKEAAGELRLNIATLRELRQLCALGESHV